MRRPLPLVLVALGVCGLLCSLGGCPGTGSVSGGTVFNLPPTVVLTAVPDPPRGVAPLTVQFDSSSSSDDGVIVDRNWDFGDGTTSKDITPQHIFQTNGTFTVKLTLTDDANVSAYKTIQVVVTERPVAVIQVDKVTAANAPATFQFDGTASYAPDAKQGETLLYRWDFGDGARDILAKLPHTYTTPGSYRVVLTVTNTAGVIGTSSVIVTVGIPQPTLSFRVPPATVSNIVCSVDSPLWVLTDFAVEPGVPYTLRAGLHDTVNNVDYTLGQVLDNGVVVYHDLDLTLPTPLSLSISQPPDLLPIPEGTYTLWAEVDTDRTTATRTTAKATVHVIPPYTSTIANDTPSLPAVSSDNWSVVLPPARSRQIFTFGPLTRGDRMYLSLLTTPGYGSTYVDGDFSVMILDGQQNLYAWYQSGGALFSADSKLIITRPPSDYFLVVDSTGNNPVPGIALSVARGFEMNPQPRRQYVYLNFGPATGITVAGSPTFNIEAFSIDPATDAVLMEQIVTRISTLLGAYDFVVLSSSRGDVEPTVPHKTIYFDTSKIGGIDTNQPPGGLVFYGASNYLDPHNETLTGRSVIDVNQISADWFTSGQSEAVRAGIIGNAAVHHLGLLTGLRSTLGSLAGLPVDDVMTQDETKITNLNLGFLLADLAPLANHVQIGRQNAPQLLQDLVGPHQ